MVDFFAFKQLNLNFHYISLANVLDFQLSYPHIMACSAPVCIYFPFLAQHFHYQIVSQSFKILIKPEFNKCKKYLFSQDFWWIYNVFLLTCIWSLIVCYLVTFLCSRALVLVIDHRNNILNLILSLFSTIQNM